MEAVASRLEAMTIRLEAIVIKLEAIAIDAASAAIEERTTRVDLELANDASKNVTRHSSPRILGCSERLSQHPSPGS